MNFLKHTAAALIIFSLLLNIGFCEDLLTLDNGTIKVGIDKGKGGSITWLSSKAYPTNMVNLADPGRLIQQSYYSGKRLDRTADGQSKSWSPWVWNPIQGGGIGSWAIASTFEKKENTLYSETIPKLWDMPNEPAQALMKQWTTFESEIPNAVVVHCEFISLRKANDRWGDPGPRSQEVPACYFTRNFSSVKSYLGNNKWRTEMQPPGPPWGKTNPPLNAMALFNKQGQGVAIYSPTANMHWNFGPHAHGQSDEATAGPCMHVAPISKFRLTPKSTLSYRYWLIVGDSTSISQSFDKLIELYSDETAKLSVN